MDPGGSRRPRGRTATILACAALLGIAGGLAAGYRIQAERPPTPLPALAAPLPVHAVRSAGEAGRAPVTLKEERALRMEGDLRKLLLKPSGGDHETLEPTIEGGVPAVDNWLSPIDFAREFVYDDGMFEALTRAGIRRVAATDRAGGDRHTAIRLAQFWPGTGAPAAGSRSCTATSGSLP
ncbi:hypothetical protein B1H18_15945 [Streptomyces tsukubensis]|uniref:Uncharacterized protein n=1 Tax=Streptomyces tsukubensis TaxID=83656 RepID=A0A1V4A9B1_9ACTN|nr:hypothetical protein B1H18_15945 [Streptomyces tsukubensis]